MSQVPIREFISGMHILRLSLATLMLGSIHAADAPSKPQPTPAPAKPEPKPQPAPARPEPKPQPAPAKPEPKPTPPSPGPTPAQQPNSQPPAVPAPVAAPAAAPKAEAPKDTKKSVEEFTKDCQLRDGLFRIHLNQQKGNIFLYIRKEQLGPEFIYFTHTMNGVAAAGHNVGRFGDESIIKIAKSFDKLEFIKQNTAFYFDPQHPLARASKANITDAVMSRETILAEDNGGYLIAAEPLFLKESMLQVKPNGTAVLGKLNEGKTVFTDALGYPDNTMFGVRYVFEGGSLPTSDKHNDFDDIADVRYVTVQVQHNLIRMPDTDYQPRFEDPRIGYFTTQVTDLTSTETTPWRDFIHRWRLVKQKPGTALSEPVKPITFWIENTTPIEFRDTIKQAALKWNVAFEKAGFKDALVIQQQPDDAGWNAGDINYNVLRWTSSPKPPFGGYGPSFVNPRTGEILGADIMLEFSYLSKRLIYRRVFAEMGIEDIVAPTSTTFDPKRCDMGMASQLGILRGNTALRLRAADKMDMDRMIKESLTKLVLHEIGHTLGLNHNFKASHLHDPVAIHNRELTSKVGLYGSVMDYPTINIAPEGKAQGEYFMSCTGPYDAWAIEFGYSEGLADPDEEAKRLNAIAARSHEPQLAFGNDADDMRSVGSGVDPDAMIYDLSSDPVTYSEQRLALDEKELSKLLETFPANGESYQELVQAYAVLTRDMTDALTATSRYIGGVHVERALKGQGAKRDPLTPVPAAQQAKAMSVLARYAFGPEAWKTSPTLIAHLQQQRRGFELGKETEDPKMHGRVFGIQQSLLNHLLHASVQQRLLDSSLYGNTYSLHNMMESLTLAIMTGEPAGATIPAVRSNLQTEYVFRLLNMLNNSAYLPTIQGVALHELHRIQKAIQKDWPAFNLTPAHRDHLLYRIRRGLDEKS